MFRWAVPPSTRIGETPPFDSLGRRITACDCDQPAPKQGAMRCAPVYKSFAINALRREIRSAVKQSDALKTAKALGPNRRTLPNER